MVKIIGTIGLTTGLVSLTLDSKYIHRRQILINRTIRKLKDGIQFGLNNYGDVLFETLIGIFKRPYEEIRKEELFLVGLVKGIYGGLIGIVVKPAVGLYDLLFSIFQGLKNEAVYEVSLI